MKRLKSLIVHISVKALTRDYFDLPTEFEKFSSIINENLSLFLPTFKKYLNAGKTSFQAIVYSADDLSNALPKNTELQETFSELAIIGYYLLSHFAKALNFSVSSDNFSGLYFLYKAAWFVNDKRKAQAFMSSLFETLVEMKQTDPLAFSACNYIVSIEYAIMNSDYRGIRKYAQNFRDVLFHEKLVQDFALISVQIASNLAYREYRLGDPDYVGWLEIYKELAEAFNMDTMRMDSYSLLGEYYRTKGYLDDATEFYEKAIQIANVIGNKEMKVNIISQIANLEHTRGNLTKALKICEQALADPEIATINPSLNISISEILIKEERFVEALNYLNKLDEFTQHKFSPEVNILFGYALTKLPGKENLHKGIKYLEKGRILSEQSRNQRLLAKFYYYRGITHLDNYDLSSAIDNFERCFRLALITEFQYVVLSQLYLAESYLLRHKISQQESDLSSSKHFLANVITICNEQKLPILPEVLSIQGLLLIVLNEFVDSAQFLKQAKALKEKQKGESSSFTQKIEEYLNLLECPDIIKAQAIISDITKAINDLAKISYVKNVDDLPNLLFLVIFTDDGKSVYSYVFDENIKFNDELISDVITTMSSSTHDESIANLKAIDFESNRILIENYGRLVVILGCETDSFNARSKLLEFVKRFHTKFQEQLQSSLFLDIVTTIKQESDLLVESIFKKKRII